MKNLQEIFSSLHDHLNAREQSLIQKLSSVKDVGASILERRKSTASFLRQTAESSQTTLEESQILELKHQIKVSNQLPGYKHATGTRTVL